MALSAPEQRQRPVPAWGASSTRSSHGARQGLLTTAVGKVPALGAVPWHVPREAGEELFITPCAQTQEPGQRSLPRTAPSPRGRSHGHPSPGHTDPASQDPSVTQ